MIPRVRFALLMVALGSFLALAAAFGSEWYGGLVPCALCLVERWPYRVALCLGLLGAILPRVWAWGAVWLCLLTLLAGAGAGFVHVGVEHGWWPSPLPQCMAPRLSGLTMAERLAAMPAHPSKPCEDPIYLMEAVPVSMAEMNVMLALALAGGLAIFSISNRRSPP